MNMTPAGLLFLLGRSYTRAAAAQASLAAGSCQSGRE
uniref:Uncharacterized protein n=1 Tax=Arundo donax TaxID=35708 RepID=A0A0A9BRP0_ARUDO